MIRRGPFIVIEGPDGSGKSTHAKELSLELSRVMDRPAILCPDPGGTPLGASLRQVVLGSELEINPVSELMIFNASRAQLIKSVVAPAVAEGKIVVMDRYAPSTIAYQGYGRGVDIDDCVKTCRTATGAYSPDVVVWLNVPLDVLRRRREERATTDRMERDQNFLERVSSIYQHPQFRAACAKVWEGTDGREKPTEFEIDAAQPLWALRIQITAWVLGALCNRGWDLAPTPKAVGQVARP